MAAEAERIILSYVHGGSGRAVKRIYISGVEPDASELSAALDRRVREKCRPLPWRHGFSEGAPDTIACRLAASALAAAVGQ
jgi:hypothetical protein